MTDSEDTGKRQTSLADDLGAIFGEFGTLASVVAILTTGLSTYINSQLEEYATVGAIVVQNVPMVGAATILAMLVLRRAYAHTSLWEGFWIVVAAIVVPYAVAWLFGLADAVDANLATTEAGCSLSRDCPEPGMAARDPGAGALGYYLNPVRIVILLRDILLFYFSPDRLPSTLSALASGIFIASVFEKRLLPRARDAIARRAQPPKA